MPWRMHLIATAFVLVCGALLLLVPRLWDAAWPPAGLAMAVVATGFGAVCELAVRWRRERRRRG